MYHVYIVPCFHGSVVVHIHSYIYVMYHVYAVPCFHGSVVVHIHRVIYTSCIHGSTFPRFSSCIFTQS